MTGTEPQNRPASPGEGESQLSLAALWSAVRKSWMLIAAVTGAVFLAVVFLTLGQTRVYEAQATVMFDPRPPRPLGSQVEAVVDTGSSQSFMAAREYYKTQHWIIKSQRIAAAVVRDLRLNHDAAFLSNSSPGASPPPREVSIDLAAELLTSRLDVEPIKDSRLANVIYHDADPARSQRILATLVDTYVQSNLDDVVDSTNSAADWLRGQAEALKKDLESSEMQLHDYKRDKNMLSVSMDDKSNMLRGEMEQLTAALTQVRTRREEARARRDELLKVKSDDPLDVPATELIQSPTLQIVREGYLEASRDTDGLIGGGKGEGHPEVKAAIARREATRGALVAEIKNIQGAVERDLGELANQEGGLKRLYAEAEGQALDLNLLEIEYNRMRRTKDNNEKLYGLVIERSKESDLTRTLMFNNIRVVERPALPRKPVSPNVPLNVAGGLLAGLVLGLAAAVGREQLDRSVKTPDDVEHELGVSFLGLLPALGNPQALNPRSARRRRGRREEAASTVTGAPELVVHDHPTSGIAEAARAIRTNILFMSPDRPYRTLLVTSAGPSEGKTTVACCIAITMAQAGRRVVLLDCDMRRPRVHRVFGMSKDVGVTTVLIDLPSLDQAIHETPVPNLSVMATGPLPPNPAEILHSEAFGKMLEALRERFDCVIIDSPPVVPVTDAAVLSTLVDGTILVVRAFQTSKELARRAVRALSDVGGHAVGTVLNAVDLDRHEYGYRYYYYYKREGYASEEAPNVAPPPS